MNTLPGINLYNQDRLSDENFVESFVARQDLLDYLVDALRRPARGGETEHHILIGARGMGKSSLLRRFAIAVKKDELLDSTFIPLRFREEQYNVVSLDAFWRNCGEALAEWCENTNREEEANALDRAIETALWKDPDKAAEEFRAACDRLNRRPILLLDNLDLIIDGLKEQECWQLRKALQARGGPVVVGAATRSLEQAGSREAPFYEFFHPLVMEPLSEAELRKCLAALADMRKEAGEPVRVILARQPERVSTLYTLTGGNPRILALIYQLLERADSETVFADLEALLDQVTPFYKARVEEYQTSQQRAIIDAIALNWDPITSGVLAEATGIEVTTISSQLSRLKKQGFVEEVSTSGARSGYQIGERFLNIWYLMRHGTRRTKQRLKWLTIFLGKLFGSDELRRLVAEARDPNRDCKWHPHYRAAVIEAFESLREDSRFEPSSQLDQNSSVKAAGSAPVPTSDDQPMSVSSDIVGAPKMMDAMVAARALMENGVDLAKRGKIEEAIAVFDDVITRYTDTTDTALQELVAGALVNKGTMLGALGRSQEAIAVYDDVVARFAEATEPALREQVARALVDKGYTLGTLGRSDEAMAVHNNVVARLSDATEPALRGQVARALVNKGVMFRAQGRSQAEIAVYDDVIARFSDANEPILREAVARALVDKGFRLETQGRSDEAIAVYDDFVTRFSDATEPALQKGVEAAIVQHGNLVFDRLGRPADAEAIYRKGLDLDIASPILRANLAWVLVILGRLDEARTLVADLSDLDKVGSALLRAGIAVASDNLGDAYENLEAALELGLDPDTSNFFVDLLRLLKLAADLGHGGRILDWWKASIQADRYAPVVGAFTAYLKGERFLLDLAPEIRQPAKLILDSMIPRGGERTEVGGAAPKKRGRPRKRPKF